VLGQTDHEIATVQLEHLKQWGYLTVSWSPRWKPALSAQDVAGLEEQLSHDPDNTPARVRLLNYYWHNQLRQQRAQSVFWLIEHHPESPILGLDIAWLFPNEQMAADHYAPMHDDADFIRARKLWESSIAQHPNALEVPEVLHNAARFFEATDPEKSEDLARRLQQVDPQGHEPVVAYYFTKVAPRFRR